MPTTSCMLIFTGPAEAPEQVVELVLTSSQAAAASVHDATTAQDFLEAEFGSRVQLLEWIPLNYEE